MNNEKSGYEYNMLRKTVQQIDPIRRNNNGGGRGWVWGWVWDASFSLSSQNDWMWMGRNLYGVFRAITFVSLRYWVGAIAKTGIKNVRKVVEILPFSSWFGHASHHWLHLDDPFSGSFPVRFFSGVSGTNSRFRVDFFFTATVVDRQVYDEFEHFWPSPRYVRWKLDTLERSIGLNWLMI